MIIRITESWASKNNIAVAEYNVEYIERLDTGDGPARTGYKLKSGQFFDFVDAVNVDGYRFEEGEKSLKDVKQVWRTV